MNAISKENRNYFMGIAIILVILHHFCLRMEDAWHVDSFPFNLFYWGQIGVDIFLFVSAYGCCASWENNKWWQYLVNRVKRIYPQYVVFLLIVLCWFYADASVLHRLKFAAYSLIGVAPIYQLGVRIEWYIPSLIMMYWFLPVLCSVINKTRRCYGGGVFVGVRCNFTTMAIERTVNILSVFSSFPCYHMWGNGVCASWGYRILDQVFYVCDIANTNNQRKYGDSFHDDTVAINCIIDGEFRKETIRKSVVFLWLSFFGNLLCTNDNYSIHDAKVFLDRQMAFVTHYNRIDNSLFVPFWGRAKII